ncbi:hypothetical protein BDR26DRAFT_855866 [Obelidium mucronatum]|nr:hypothetical protein BDR26DRAFT_855866 [Obelidium mucronatum]
MDPAQFTAFLELQSKQHNALLERLDKLEDRLRTIENNLPALTQTTTTTTTLKRSSVIPQALQLQQGQSQQSSSEIISRLTDLDHKIEMLPLIYYDTVATALQRQTNSLMKIFDSIVQEQTETIQSVVVSSTSAADRNSSSSSLLRSSIPDLGIKKRFSLLVGGLGKTGGFAADDTRIQPEGSIIIHADKETPVQEERKPIESPTEGPLEHIETPQPLHSRQLIEGEDLC